MRIAFLTSEFVTEPYFTGGLANYLHRVGRALVERGHEVLVVTQSTELPRRLEHVGIRVHRVPAGGLRRRFAKLAGGRLKATIGGLDFAWAAFRELHRLHAERPLDVVQAASYQAPGLISSALLPVPHVVRVSSFRPAWREAARCPAGRDVRLLEWLERLQMRRAKHVYAPSDCVRRMIEERTGLRGVDVVRPPFFVEVDAWNSTVADAHSDRPYALFFGRMQLHKGVGVLAEALPRFLAAHPDARVLFAGPDQPSELGPSLEGHVRQRCGADADRVRFLGPLRHDRLYPVVAGAQLVVLPSLVDNLPNSLLESLGLGKPVIGTFGTSFDELIDHGENGFLVPPGDADALASTMIDAWTHPDLGRIGEAAQLVADRLNVDRTVGELERYFERVVGKPAAALAGEV